VIQRTWSSVTKEGDFFLLLMLTLRFV